MCIGESLAKMELFLFFTSLLQHFRFTPPPGVTEEELDLAPSVGFTLTPLPHELCAVRRHWQQERELPPCDLGSLSHPRCKGCARWCRVKMSCIPRFHWLKASGSESKAHWCFQQECKLSVCYKTQNMAIKCQMASCWHWKLFNWVKSIHHILRKHSDVLNWEWTMFMPAQVLCLLANSGQTVLLTLTHDSSLMYYYCYYYYYFY